MRPNLPPVSKQQPSVSQSSIANKNIIQEEIQEVVPIKAEPKESHQPMTNTTTNVQEQSLTTYQEEEVDQVYEDYSQYEEEQYTEAYDSTHNIQRTSNYSEPPV